MLFGGANHAFCVYVPLLQLHVALHDHTESKLHTCCVANPDSGMLSMLVHSPKRRLNILSAQEKIRLSLHLCLAAGFQHERRVRLYDVDNNWRLRKDVEARNLRWTITDTCISPDQKFLLYSSISPIVHLVGARPNSTLPPLAVQHAQASCTCSSVGRCLVLQCQIASGKQGMRKL